MQPEAYHYGIKIRFTEFQWIGPYIIDKILQNNNYLVRKISISKGQVLHRMQLRQFTTRQTLPDVQITPQEWKSDPELSIKHADLYARAWECDYERPIFDAKYENTAPPNPLDFVIQSDLLPEETWNTPGTSRERSLEIRPPMDGLCDGTDTYHYMEHDAEMSLEQHHPLLTSPAVQNTTHVTLRSLSVTTIAVIECLTRYQ